MPPITGASFLHRFNCVHSLSNSEALGTATLLFHQQLRRSIGEGKVDPTHLIMFLDSLAYLHPFQVANRVEYGFLWITDILNSGYTDHERFSMARVVIHLLGIHLDNTYLHFRPSWVSPLMNFLLLGEQFHSTESPPYSGFVALRILSFSPGSSDFGTKILPVLTSTLAPTHPLKSRSLALGVFHRLTAGWFSPQMEKVPSNDLNRLLQAVDDPFQFPDLPLQDEQPVVTADYKPMKVAVILIEFASSDLWRNHLRRSNFTSCEDILSTEEGRKTALECMFDMAAYLWSEFLCTPAKIITAIRRLEELQCLNTAEVVILWAWTAGVVNPVDNDAWGSIERNTLDFYQSHGIRRLAALSRHITNASMEDLHLEFLLMHYHGPPCRVGSVQQLVPYGEARRRWDDRYFEVLRVTQVCQLRRLYHLFGYDPMTWKEAVGVAEAGEVMDKSPGQSVMPVQFTDWACDYP